MIFSMPTWAFEKQMLKMPRGTSMQKEGRLAAEAEEMYHMKVYMVPFSVHGGGTSLIVDILSEFILDI
jgi:LDH2 family malate/lactate/ureidoglycolate dehydrogenase